MNRRGFLRCCASGVIGAAFTASAAVAQSFEGAVLAQLRGQGYREINVERTMLGRVRIVAGRGGASREIILNPRTGEILRDVVVGADGQVLPEISGSGGSGSGSSGDDGSDEGSGEDGSGEDGSGEEGSGEGKGGKGGEGEGEGGSGKGGGESED